MKCEINDNKIEIKHKYIRINTKPSRKPDYYSKNYVYRANLEITTDKELNTYEREKIEDFIRYVINED